jgi:flagellin-like hook-associated protein FlgL
MSSIPSNIARVPNSLVARLALTNLGRTNSALLQVQQQIATGRAILRPSDNIVRSATIGVLDDRLELSSQRIRNLQHGAASLNIMDSALEEANDLALQAKSIASEQLNITSSATERAGQAVVVDSLLQSLFTLANRESVAGHIFGGSITSRPPIEPFLGGYRYVGSGPGLTTDLGLASSVPITLGEGNPISARSSRVRGSVDLNPNLTADTRLADLEGARGLGISAGTVQFSVNGGTPVTIDLNGADTIGDVVTRLTASIREY